MNDSFSYGLAFVAGLLGSGHCVGMCGALVSSFFMRVGQSPYRTAGYFAYHGARIGVYTLVGFLAALLGVALVSTGIIGKAQGLLQILIGIYIVLLALEMLGVLPFRVSFSLMPDRLRKQGFCEATRRQTVSGSAVAGTVNGFMPCPLTLAWAVKATAAPSAPEGALLMLAFGAGTLPSMLLVSTLFGRIGIKARTYLMRAAAVVVLVMGVATVLQGARFYDAIRNLANW